VDLSDSSVNKVKAQKARKLMLTIRADFRELSAVLVREQKQYWSLYR
jgi:hypothetical protein